MLRTFNTPPRLWFILALSLIGLLVVTSLSVTTLKDSQLQEKQTKPSHLVENAHSLVRYFYNQFKSGALSGGDTKQAAVNVAKALRYEGKDDFWLNDMAPSMVMHPSKPSLDGKDLSQVKDPNGKRLFIEFARTVKQQSTSTI